MNIQERRELTYKEIRKNEEINLLIKKGNDVLGVLGYTDHSKKHAAKVAVTAGKILKDLGYDKHQIEQDCWLYARYRKQHQSK